MTTYDPATGTYKDLGGQTIFPTNGGNGPPISHGTDVTIITPYTGERISATFVGGHAVPNKAD